MELTLEEIKKHIDRDERCLDISRCRIHDNNIVLVCRYLKI